MALILFIILLLYWKNGKLVFSTDSYDFANAKPNDILVNGTDVYMVGYERQKAMLWKNGVPTALPTGTNTGVASSVKIIGSDVYIIGYDISGPYLYGIRYWKNGTLVTIKEGLTGAASSFAISGSDIYIAGSDYYYQGKFIDKTIAKYWVNGVESGTFNRNYPTLWCSHRSYR